MAAKEPEMFLSLCAVGAPTTRVGAPTVYASAKAAVQHRASAKVLIPSANALIASGKAAPAKVAGPASTGTSKPTPMTPTLLAQDAGAYQRKLAAAGVKIDFATAVRAVHEGKTI